MGAALLKNFESYLGENWTPEVEQAWTDAYDKIANIMLEGAEHCESTFGRRIRFSRVINRMADPPSAQPDSRNIPDKLLSSIARHVFTRLVSFLSDK